METFVCNKSKAFLLSAAEVCALTLFVHMRVLSLWACNESSFIDHSIAIVDMRNPALHSGIHFCALASKHAIRH